VHGLLQLVANLEASGNLIADALASVPGCESGRPPDLMRPLTGGRGVNDIRLVQTSAGRFVLRMRLGPLDRPGAAAMQELNCHRAAARAGCAPPLIATAPDGRWLVMPYLDGPGWQASDLREISAIEALGRKLGELHDSVDVAALEPMDPVQLAGQQRDLILACGRGSPAEVHTLVEQVRQGVEALAEAGVRAVLNHGDLQVSNIFGRPPRFIDWEYAQVADPTYDLACLLTYYPELGKQKMLLLAAAGLSAATAAPRLEAQLRLFAALNRLWALAFDIRAG
jgi:aminoglycoside phosphotransferase (APT) family kinase protein